MEGGAKVKCKSCNDNKGAYNYSSLCSPADVGELEGGRAAGS